MAEKSEHEASKTGQDKETPEAPEGAKRDSQGVPRGTGDENGQQTFEMEGDESAGTDQNTGYQESEDHVPDPTALTGTLETSGTGGGVHERLIGTTRIFGDVEHVIQKVESLIQTRVSEIQEEVRGLLLQHETSAKAANIPQQSVEEHGLPSHQGNIIAPNDDSGAAKDSSRSANVAGSPDDVSAGAEPVQDPADDTYQQTSIAGAKNPSEPVEKAKAAEDDGKTEETEKTESDSADDYEKKLNEVVSGKTPAKKTASRRQGNSGGNTKK